MNFRFTKQLIKIIFGVFITISLFITFTQEAFQSDVSANLLLTKTPPFPVYFFIIGAFLVGLIIGLIIAVADHFHMAKKMQELIDENKSITATISIVEEEVISEENPEESEKAPEA